jgi:hypothetical protein
MKPCHMFRALSQVLYLSKSAFQITEVYAAYKMPPCTPIPLIPNLGDTLYQSPKILLQHYGIYERLIVTEFCG